MQDVTILETKADAAALVAAEIKSANPFLDGIHTPMTDELELTELAVTGEIPAGFDGRYMRIGPNPAAAPDAERYHWFTGDGMVHGLAIAEGKALWYRNRWIRSEAVAKARGVEAAPGPRHSFDTVNTNVVGIGGRIWALVEAGGYPVELSQDMEEQASNPFDGTLAGAFSAHPHLDPRTGEMHAICYEGFEPGKLSHVVVDSSGKVVREEPIALPHAPMIHDSAITERFVVVLDFPVTFSVAALSNGSTFPYNWNPAQPARIGLMPRGGSQQDILWCPVEPGFAFHVVNAYDRADGKVVIDLCVYDSMFSDGAHGPDARSRGLERWTVDPETRSVAVRTIDASPQEFPRLDERRFGQAYRYAYTMALPAEPAARFLGESKLYRHDLETGARQVHDFGVGRVPGEFVFVPKGPDSAEEEGWLVGLVIDTLSERTDLVILDTTRFEGEPQAVVHLPHRIPPGFHGNWIASAA
ncbi:carotenoid oxygenase family protein [Sphingomonas sp. JC676]|uniref:8'-apo-carotenoid 13,14-cleaving dioxygenase n=1 Tax=Sphingomonas sp. JC676 TaxID=2768065 RepID=UPI00165812C1|nr:carotenoid oxygenase family protein [Sphingomonas sp. JC676]MBC9033035.1 carotenoid oxygenase family protein [Sphingomonas sp. JC676]